MIYRELPLPEPLRRVALCAWQFVIEDHDPPQFPHQVPPDGSVGLTVVRSPDGGLHRAISGPMLAAFTVPVGRGFTYSGLRLRPEMSQPVLGEEPLVGRFDAVPGEGALAPVWQDIAALATGGTDWAGTAGAFAAVADGDAAAAGAVDRLIASGGTLPVSRLAALAQLSERQLRRRFHAATGVAPKQYADVQRARRALVLALEDPDWAGIAHESGFADQPHMIRDIKERYGAAPRRVSGYFCGMRHELLEGGDVRNIQAGAARAA